MYLFSFPETLVPLLFVIWVRVDGPGLDGWDKSVIGIHATLFSPLAFSMSAHTTMASTCSVERLAFRVQRQIPSLILSARTKSGRLRLFLLFYYAYNSLASFPLRPGNGDCVLVLAIPYPTSAVRTPYEGSWLALFLFTFFFPRQTNHRGRIMLVKSEIWCVKCWAFSTWGLDWRGVYGAHLH